MGAAEAELRAAEANLRATEAQVRADVEIAVRDYEARKRILTATYGPCRSTRRKLHASPWTRIARVASICSACWILSGLD